MHLLGVIAAQHGHREEAINLIQRAITFEPENAEFFANLGNTFNQTGRLDEAIAAYTTASQLDPNLASAHNHLGVALTKKGEIGRAVECHRHAISLNSNDAAAFFNLAVALAVGGCDAEAIDAYRQAIKIAPGWTDPHWNLALQLLIQGDYANGLEEYEWRYRRPSLAGARVNYSQPVWDGSDFHGKTLLLYAEQGWGDAIQFVRYVPRALQGGGRVILKCRPALHRLFRSISKLELVAPDYEVHSFDIQCPLMSLPRIFKTARGNDSRACPLSFR